MIKITDTVITDIGHPKILSRSLKRASPWVTLIEREVEFAEDQAPEVYHSIAQADYVGILAVTNDGLVPIVRQYRSAVEEWTWELPAGLLDEGETPEACCRRELAEETGVEVTRIESLGTLFPDTGRLSNQMHAFFAETTSPNPAATIEEGLSVKLVEPTTLHQMMLNGTFRHQLHIGLLTLAALKGLWKLEAVTSST